MFLFKKKHAELTSFEQPFLFGISDTNSNGENRQKIIAQMRAGNDVVLKPTPSKDYPFSISVLSSNGKIVGVLPTELSKRLMKEYAQNKMSAVVLAVTKENTTSYNLKIKITVYA